MLMVGFCGDLSENFKVVMIMGMNILFLVELLEFQVFVDLFNGVCLDWIIIVEENNVYFFVECLVDG